MSPGIGWRRLSIGMVVLAVALGALALVARGGLARGETYELVLAPGTSTDLDPAMFATLPHRRVGEVVWIELERGDTLRLVNEDDVTHTVWALSARPGETVEQRFLEHGTFSGECSFAMTIFIEVR